MCLVRESWRVVLRVENWPTNISYQNFALSKYKSMNECNFPVLQEHTSSTNVTDDNAEYGKNHDVLIIATSLKL